MYNHTNPPVVLCKSKTNKCPGCRRLIMQKYFARQSARDQELDRMYRERQRQVDL